VFSLEPTEVFESTHEGLLHHVLGIGVVAHQGTGETQSGLCMGQRDALELLGRWLDQPGTPFGAAKRASSAGYHQTAVDTCPRWIRRVSCLFLGTERAERSDNADVKNHSCVETIESGSHRHASLARVLKFHVEPRDPGVTGSARDACRVARPLDKRECTSGEGENAAGRGTNGAPPLGTEERRR
jgi:hypothetical protein